MPEKVSKLLAPLRAKVGTSHVKTSTANQSRCSKKTVISVSSMTLVVSRSKAMPSTSREYPVLAPSALNDIRPVRPWKRVCNKDQSSETATKISQASLQQRPVKRVCNKDQSSESATKTNQVSLQQRPVKRVCNKDQSSESVTKISQASLQQRPVKRVCNKDQSSESATKTSHIVKASLQKSS